MGQIGAISPGARTRTSGGSPHRPAAATASTVYVALPLGDDVEKALTIDRQLHRPSDVGVVERRCIPVDEQVHRQRGGDPRLSLPKASVRATLVAPTAQRRDDDPCGHRNRGNVGPDPRPIAAAPGVPETSPAGVERGLLLGVGILVD